MSRAREILLQGTLKHDDGTRRKAPRIGPQAESKSPTAIREGDVKTAPVPVEIEVAAEVYVPSSLKALIHQLTNGAGDQARVRAANLILDRGYVPVVPRRER